MKKLDQRIEPSRGATYSSDKIAVYEYDTYPSSSVLSGQTRRSLLDEFDTVEQAKVAYPHASVSVGSGHQPVSLSHLPDADGPDPFGDNEHAARET